MVDDGPPSLVLNAFLIVIFARGVGVGDGDGTGVGEGVGAGGVSPFSQEYSRRFGEPAPTDAKALGVDTDIIRWATAAGVAVRLF